MIEDQKIIDAVVNYPGGCQDEKTRFLKSIGLDWPQKKITVTFEIDVDKVQRDSYISAPDGWTDKDWQHVLTKNNDGSRFPKAWHDQYRNALKVTSVE